MNVRSRICAISAFAVVAIGRCLFAQGAGQDKPPTVTPGHLEFGNIYIGARTAPVGVKVNNFTNSKLRFTVSRDPHQPDYTIEKDGCRAEVAPQGSCEIDVSFSPIADGAREGTLQIEYPAGADSKQPTSLTVTLNGNGIVADLGVSPAQLRFPAQCVSTSSAPQTVILTNNSASDISLNNIVASDDFIVEPQKFPQTLEEGRSVAVAVVFKPKRGGNVAGKLTILSSANPNPLEVQLSGKTKSFLGGLCSDCVSADRSLAFVLCLCYWLAMVVVRWHRVARSTRELLRAQITSLKAELDTLTVNQPPPGPVTLTVKELPPGPVTLTVEQPPPGLVTLTVEQPPPGSVTLTVEQPPPGPDTLAVNKPPPGPANLKGLLMAARDLIDPTKEAWVSRVANFLFWSRGQEMTGWGYVHEVEVQMIPYLAEATVTARLESAEQKLRATTDAPGLALANAIHTALTCSPPADASRRQALLAEALSTIYDRKDNSYADLVSWQNKTSWLVGCGLVLIFVLVGAFPQQSILLLVGATGGLLSRLSRSLDRKDVPTDYGASWTTLFLSPVAGALGAWAGILIAELAANANVLGSTFKASWDPPHGPRTLAIALLFGFSERLLDGVLDKLTGKALGDDPTNAKKPPAAAPSTPPAKLAITTQKLPAGKLNTPYPATLEATGAAGTPKWSVLNGDLPTGLRLEPNGTFTGAPTVPKTFLFTVQVADQNSTDERHLAITIT